MAELKEVASVAEEKVVVSRLPDEDEYAYIYRVCAMKDVLGTWTDVADVLNAQLGYEYTESKYRKQYQSFQKMFTANQERFQQTDIYLKELQERTRELNKERIKLQSEKVDYNRWLRENARDELITEKIVEAIRELPTIEPPALFPWAYAAEDAGDKAGILCYGDEHFGAEVEIKGLHGEVINSYSPEIFMQRMNELLSEVLKKIAHHGFTKIKVYSFGDEIDGILRVSQLMKLRYGVVESALRYAEFMSHWLNKLSAAVEVEFHMAEGNHSELRMIGQPKGTFTEDNMSRVIKTFIKVRMESNPRFTIVENESGLIYDNIFSMNILGIHGEVKNMASAIKNFSMMYSTPIDIMIGGHKHHCSAETVGIKKDVISIPSVIGVDTYSMQIGKTSNAGATFLVVEDGKGVTEQHNIKFSI